MSAVKRALLACLVLLVIGACFLAIVLASEWLLLPHGLESVGRALYRIVYFLGLPIVALTGDLGRADHSWSTPLLISVYFAAPFLWFSFYLVYRLAWRAARPAPTEATPALTRRRFLFATTIGAVAAGLAAYPILAAPQRLAVRRYTIPIPDLPMSLEGLRLVHVSDTHYGPFVSLRYIRHAIDTANALIPDVVLLTGDYIHRTAEATKDGVGIFANLEGRFGTVATLGNHDWWHDPDGCKKRLDAISARRIDNARVFLTPDGVVSEPVDGESLCLAGLGDLWTDVVSFDAALRDVPPGMPRILLSHNPDTAERAEAARYRVDLMLAGHTHGGQVRFPGIGTPIVPSDYGSKYAGGLCPGPNFPVLVSRGVGMAILPVRFNVPPEISVIELRVQI